MFQYSLNCDHAVQLEYRDKLIHSNIALSFKESTREAAVSKTTPCYSLLISSYKRVKHEWRSTNDLVRHPWGKRYSPCTLQGYGRKCAFKWPEAGGVHRPVHHGGLDRPPDRSSQAMAIVQHSLDSTKRHTVVFHHTHTTTTQRNFCVGGANPLPYNQPFIRWQPLLVPAIPLESSTSLTDWWKAFARPKEGV